MDTLKIHADGEEDYLQSLNLRYERLKTSLKKNAILSKAQVQEELAKIKELYFKSKKDSSGNLY